MDLSNKQITFHKPAHVSSGLNEGLRAVAEQYDGNLGRATDHCLARVAGLSEAKLTRSRSRTPPGYTRDGGGLITLLWVLLADGMLRQRPVAAAHAWLVAILDATDLFEEPVTEAHLPAVITLFTGSVRYAEGTVPPAAQTISQTLTQVWAHQSETASGIERALPVYNRLFIGREEDVATLHARLGVTDRRERQSFTIVRGWPGVGKTALVNTLVHDDAVKGAFGEGVLWASFGPGADLLATFKTWARELGARHLLALDEVQEVQAGLRAALAGRDILIVADDVWTEAQGNYIKHAVDLKANTLLMTTRFTDIATALSDVEGDIYVLGTLSEPDAIELLAALAEDAVALHRARMPQLVRAVEGLPLALRVAGPLLAHYHKMGFDVGQLIDEFEHDYNRLLSSTAPSDRFDEATGKTPTIELLFQRSVETLTETGQFAFASLGVFQHKPATFDKAALDSVWGDEANQVLGDIVGRGLMDPTPDRRFRIHQTLHMYANKLLDAYESDPAEDDDLF